MFIGRVFVAVRIARWQAQGLVITAYKVTKLFLRDKRTIVNNLLKVQKRRFAACPARALPWSA
jgi:hypothetical protein